MTVVCLKLEYIYSSVCNALKEMLCQRRYYSIIQSLGWPLIAEEFLEIVISYVDARWIRCCDWFTR